MKSLLAFTAAVLSAAILPHASAQTRPIYVTVNGSTVEFMGAQPIERYGRVLVPLRDIMLPLGAVLTWSPRTAAVTAAHGDTTVWMKMGSQVARVNGQKVWLDVPPRTVKGYTMVPLRFFSDAFGADVAWDPITQTVAIDTMNGQSAIRTAGMGSVRRFSRSDTDAVPPAVPGPPANANAGRMEAQERFNAEFRRYAGDPEYVRFLRDQDFRRYMSSRSTWMTDYQEYRRARANAETAATNYEDYLLDRDFGVFTDNREMWRISYDAFLRQRRVLNPLTNKPNWSTYFRDRDSLVRDTDRLVAPPPPSGNREP